MTEAEVDLVAVVHNLFCILPSLGRIAVAGVGFDSSAFAERINVSRTDIPGTNLVIACFKRFVLTKEIASAEKSITAADSNLGA